MNFSDLLTRDLVSVPPVAAQKVAATAARATDPEKRRLIWYLQWASHQPGGLAAFAREMLALVIPNRLGTPAMRAAGVGVGIIYSGEIYDRVCHEIDSFEHQPKDVLERDRDMLCGLYSQYAARRLGEIKTALRPENRRAHCVDLLKICAEKLDGLPAELRKLCIDPDAGWVSPYFEGFVEAVREVVAHRAAAARSCYASTKIAGYVHDAMSFAYRNRSLVVIHGTERLGKSVATRLWQETNAGCARLVDLTAATTDLLFYQELFKALGCGEVKRGDANELRAGIRAAVETCDLMLIFDEAHCLFGLSARASIKRLEYLRTEFVNRGIPVVLVVTPQFSDRLREMERTTGFNVNQFRGRITKWAELPKKPSRGDVECVCRHLLPGLSDECTRLMVDCAMSAEAPMAALNNAVLEARVEAEKAGVAITDPDTIRLAIGYSLATRQMLDTSIPAPKPDRPTRRRTPAPTSITPETPVTPAKKTPTVQSAGVVQAACTRNAKEVPAAAATRGQGALCVA